MNPYDYRKKSDRSYLTEENVCSHLCHLGAAEFDGEARDSVPIVMAYIAMLKAEIRSLKRAALKKAKAKLYSTNVSSDLFASLQYAKEYVGKRIGLFDVEWKEHNSHGLSWEAVGHTTYGDQPVYITEREVIR